MDTSDLTIELLKGIRDEVSGMRVELRERARARRIDLDETNGLLATRKRGPFDSEVRLSTELLALGDAVRELRESVRDDHSSTARLDDHERRIVALEKRNA